ncbi:hypothetical protein A4X03_0g9728 [Tilletia caries]|uniref:Uncharacterized protein n=1 Tax=Tilletia caries TaxID=13290 RepID=A0A177SYE6_9BASI|nr:hypothetical protein A4X03_0g9728 [Tilletia caries]
MGGMTAAGSKLAISAGTPATMTEAGFTALTYTVVGLVEKLGPIGRTFDEVTFQPLDGDELVFKGPSKNGALNPTMAADPDDAGQALMHTASEDRLKDYPFKVIRPDGSLRYFMGKVFGMPESIEGAATVITANPTVRINSVPINVPAPVGP